MGQTRAHWFLLVAGLAAQPGFADKIHPKTARDAANEGKAHVFVVLKDQPHGGIVRRWEGAAGLSLGIAEGEVQRLARVPAGVDRDLRDAAARRDAIVVEARRGAMREIEDAIRLGQTAVSSRLAGLGARDIQPYSIINMFAAEVPASALAALEADPEVEAVLPVEWHRAELDISVPAMGVASFWERGWTGGGQAVAVLDSGVRTSHPTFSGVDLVNRVFGRYASQAECFGDDVQSPEDLNGHGSHVAGIVAGQGSSGFPALRGAARGVGALYNLKVGFVQKSIQGRCSSGASSSTADMIQAIGWAIENTPTRIFNYSYGGDLEADDSPSARLVDYIADAFNVTVLIAAGNEGPGSYTVGSPGNAYNGITVANVDARRTVDRSDDVIAESSSRGPLVGGRYKPDVAAPGSRIYSAAHNSDGFVAKTGTSMATPLVAGAVAMLRQVGITEPRAIKAALINSADGNGWNQAFGWGYINLTTATGQPKPFTGSLAASSTVFLRGRATGAFKSTLVWNRHVQTLASDSATRFEDLDLYLYSALNNSLLDASDEAKQNVEQVRATFSGDVVVKIKSGRYAGSDAEEFALALGESGFSTVKAPDLAVRCSPPASIAPGSSFTLSCEASNRGGMDAFGVSGTLSLPQGFTGSGLQSFGTIAAGGSVTRVFMLKAPATAGDFRGTMALASNSYGEVYSASANVSYAVAGTAGPSLVLDQTSLAFTYQAGGSVPAAKQVRVLGGDFTTSVSGGAWLKATPEQGSGSFTVSVVPANLTPGTYNGAVTVAVSGAANSPQTLAIRLTVSGPGNSSVAVSEKMMTRALAEGTGCPMPTAASTFVPTDQQAYLWFSVTGAAAGDRPSLEWQAPDGSQYQTGQWNAVSSGGNWCFWSGLDIAGHPPASKTGTWTVKVNWNGTSLFSLDFTISQPVSVEKSLFTDALESGCAIPAERTSFSTTDARVYFWFLVGNAATGDSASIKWYRPDGSIHRSTSWTPLDSGGRWCFHDSVTLAGREAASFPGTWTAKVSWNDNLLLSATFTLAPPVVIERKLMARSVEDDCVEPEPVTSFVPWDPEAVLWLSVGKGKVGDRPSVEWYTPSGELWVSDSWDPLDSDGNWCLWSSIYLADHDAAKQLGEWTVKFYWNGNLMFSMPFQVVPVRVNQRMTARTVPVSESCTAPTPADRFLTSDPRVYAWYNVQQAKSGDRPRMQWLTPSGSVYKELSFDPITADGDWCFWSWIGIADLPPANAPGTWNVKAFWNDLPLFTMPFQIARENGGNAAMGASTETPSGDAAEGGQTYTGPSPTPAAAPASSGGQGRGTGCRLNLNRK